MGCGVSRSAQYVAPLQEPETPHEFKIICRKCKDVEVTGCNFCPGCSSAIWPTGGALKPRKLPLALDASQKAVSSSLKCFSCGTFQGKDTFCRGCGRRCVTDHVDLPGDASAEKLEFVPMPLSEGSVREQLTELLSKKPFLDTEEHHLSYFVARCREAIDAAEWHDAGHSSGDAEATTEAEGDDKGDGEADAATEARNAFDSLMLAWTNEERTMAAAFRTFDSNRSGVLEVNNVKLMMEYLGFPCSDSDVESLMQRVDTSCSGTVTFAEFVCYVGDMGGCQKLFEGRRKQIEGKRGREFEDAVNEDSDIELKLLQCGIQLDAQASWKLVSSGSDLDAMVDLKPCQQAALRHIRAIAQENHERALPYLQSRITSLGFRAEDLTMVLLWIRDLAPIICHVDLDKCGDAFANDTHYRNQFETNTSSGLLKHQTRRKWERTLFGSAYEDACPFDRPKYGVQNTWNDYRGVMGCKQYGDSFVVLKDVRLRSTCSAQDSGNLMCRRLAVLDFYAHVLLEYSDEELREVLHVASGNSEQVGDSAAVVAAWGKYKEVQIHGPICLENNVRRLVVHERHRGDPKIDEIRKMRQWPVVWMDELRDVFHDRAQNLTVKLPGHAIATE
eukprot:TRINITY_DN37084_c0_g1_i1.p1 TRINITY_DN37084_c0_g1~~TRINITY_DN37084_c0_g1_i1.p1  ORF type:complete len:616 (-),score=77.24 TRINITY_DN37084_c0_g1_i1:145-1992(-)